MNKKSLQTLKAFCLIIAAIAFGTNVFAQVSGVTFSESFDGTPFAPAGWKIEPIGGFGGNLWAQVATGVTPTCTTHSGAGMAQFNSFRGVTGATQTLITPVIDYSNRGSSTPTVSIWVYRDSANLTVGDSLTISVNTVDTTLGATRIGAVARSMNIALPNTEVAAGWYQYTFNVPASFNTAANYLLFTGTKGAVAGRRTPGRYIYVDDINWTAFPPLCSGTPNVGNIVKSVSLICGGSGSAQLSLTSPITASGITYQWQSSTNGTSGWAPLAGSSNLPTASTGTITSTMYYQCVVTCSVSSATYSTTPDSVRVSSHPIPTVKVTPHDSTVCSGTPFTLTASGTATSFVWSPTTGLNNPNSAIVVDTLKATQNYIVTGSDAFGCQDTAKVTIIVNPSPSAVITSSIPNDTICNGTTIYLSVPRGGGRRGGYTYLWSSGSIYNIDTLAPTSTTTYTVTVTNPTTSCSATNSVTVVVNSGTPPTISVNPTTATYCTGGAPVMLVASGTATSYTWSPATGLNTTTNDTVLAAPTGGRFGGGTVYTVVGSNGVCSVSTTVTVNTGTAPTGTVTSNLVGDSVCAGGIVILNGPRGGRGGAYTYSWSNGPTTQGDTITSVTANTTFILTVSAGACSKNDTVNVFLAPGTAPNLTLSPSGAASYCSNTSGLLLVAGGATTYSWTPATGLNKTTGDSVIATPGAGPGTVYTVIGSNGGCKATASVTVTANNAPAKATVTSAPSDSVCAGSVVRLTLGGRPGRGNTYQWSNGSIASYDSFALVTSGIYTATVTNTAGCSTIDSISLFVKPGITANFSITNSGNTYTFTDATSGSTAWSWSFGDTTTSTTQNPIHTYTYGGTYIVTLVATASGSAGCNTGSKSDTIKVGASGIANIENNKINLTAYPNPANDAANVTFNVDAAQAQIVIMNTLGQSVMNKTIYPKVNHNYSEKISLNDLSSGIYMIQIIAANSTTSIKLIKE